MHVHLSFMQSQVQTNETMHIIIISDCTNLQAHVQSMHATPTQQISHMHADL